MSNTPLQQFAKKESAWRFLKLALKLRSPEPAFGYVLIRLADHANSEGVCYPGYGLLMAETGYASKQTITGALMYWKRAGVLTWKKGWGNAHKSKSSVYQLHEDVMWKLIGAQKTDSRNLSEGSDEISVTPDEISVTPVLEISVTPMKSHLVVAKVSALEGPSNQTSQLAKGGAAPHSDSENRRQEEGAKHTHLGESSQNEISSAITPSEISSPAHTIPDAVGYDPDVRRWVAKRGIDRPLTTDEIEAKDRLNADHIRPEMIQ